MFDEEVLRVALGGVALELEDATTLDALKSVVGSLIEALDTSLQSEQEEEVDGDNDTSEA